MHTPMNTILCIIINAPDVRGGKDSEFKYSLECYRNKNLIVCPYVHEPLIILIDIKPSSPLYQRNALCELCIHFLCLDQEHR